ncbi:MAG: DNA-directed RNA polymerase subunit alpha [bacterium]
MEKTLWKGMERPRKVIVEQDTLTPTYGKFIAEPFERGYGITIGNSLRRVLISSLPGAAVTSVKFEGITHEFTTIPEIKEDVTDIILNLKELVLKLNGTGPVNINLNVHGEKEVKAKDIEAPSSIEILNPEQHIATLGKRGKLNLELTVDVGRGYVPAEFNKKEGQAIGVIPVDSLFSPVKKVTFDVQKTRIGQMTDYDRVVLEIWTNGSIKPEDALGYAAKIVKDHMSVFINFEEKEEVISDEKDEDKKLNELLDQSVEELELSVRAANCLRNSEIKTIRDLVHRSEIDMLKFRNFGRKSLNEIKEILVSMGLSFGMKIDEKNKKRKEE